jgi:hypothetical protein
MQTSQSYCGSMFGKKTLRGSTIVLTLQCSCPTLILLIFTFYICRKSDEAKKSQPIMNDKNLAEWVTSKSISGWNAEVTTDKPLSEKAKLKAQARESKKTPRARDDCSHPSDGSILTPPIYSFQKASRVVVNDSLHPTEGSIPKPPRYSFSVVKSQPDDLDVTPRNPLSQNKRRDVGSGKSDVPEKISPQKRQKVT